MTKESISAEVRALERRASAPWLILTSVAAADVLSVLSFLAALD
jgi:hypothetical protein